MRITWQPILDDEVRAYADGNEKPDAHVGLVRPDPKDTMFYQAIVGGEVVATTNMPFEAMLAVEDAVRRAALPTPPTEPDEMLGTLKIEKNEHSRTSGGRWVVGTIAGHRFDALVFAEHAANASYELHQSRISKLWIKELATKREVACFDRGWDVAPATDAAQQIVDLLSAGLAETVYGK